MRSPVALFLFNRPDLTERLMARLNEVRPARLLVIADGPRPDRQGEAEACAEVRRIVARPEWPCHVARRYSETNLGCRRRLETGLDWIFSREEEAIILEDDCLPSPAFFPYCDALLEHHRVDPRVGAILGTNLSGERLEGGESYFFSRLFHPWGWAAWRRSWEGADGDLAKLSPEAAAALLAETFADPRVRAFFADKLARARRGEIDTWDFQFGFTQLARRALSITPAVSLVENLGCGRADATHMAGETALGGAPPGVVPGAGTGARTGALVHPEEVAPFDRADRAIEAICLALRLNGVEA